MKRKAAQRSTAFLAVVGASALVLTGCAAGSTPSTSSTVSVPGATDAQNKILNSLYKSAVKDKKTQIVVYGPSGSTSVPIFTAFGKQFPGITVVPQDQADSTTLSKLKVEASSGKRQADLVMGGAQAVTVAAADPTLCTSPNVTTAPKDQVGLANDGRMLLYGVKYFGFVYNTQMVKQADVPTTWDELLGSKWKGKIEMPDPTVLGGAKFLLADMLLPEAKAEFGEAYLKKLAAQSPTFSSNEPNISADVAAGRFPLGVGVFVGYYAIQKDKGAPISFQFPLKDGGNFTSSTAACLVKDAPDIDAAKLYLNWLFTKEGQKQLAALDHTYGTLPGSPGPLGAPTLKNLKALHTLGNNLPAYQPYFEVVTSIFTK